jgi:hypothetical protein
MLTTFPEVPGVEFARIVRHPTYCFGNDGSAWNLRRKWRQLRPHRTRYGYLILQVNSKTMRLHRLILEAFTGPCPQGMQACHTDGNRSNNCLSNLRWDTPAGNAVDRNAHGTTARGSRQGLSKLEESDVLEIRRLVGEGQSRASVGRIFGVSTTQVCNIVDRLQWAHVG